MFGKIMWLFAVLAALLFMTCDLESGNKDNPGGNDKTISPPTNVRAVAVSATSISVTWNPVAGATSYEVFYETGSIPTSALSTVAGTSYTHTGLKPNTAYHYYVTAKNSAGTSGYSSRASATTQSQ